MALKIVSDGSEGGHTGFVGPRRSRGAPALRLPISRPRASVKVSRRLTQLYRAIDWGFVAFTLAVAVTVFVGVYVALERVR